MTEKLLAILVLLLLFPLPTYAYFRLAIGSDRPGARRWGAVAGLVPLLCAVILALGSMAFLPLGLLALPAIVTLAAAILRPRVLERRRLRLYVSIVVGAALASALIATVIVNVRAA